MGHWHFWTTPEEVGERQPLRLDGLPFTLVFDGRLDNREELFAALSISAEEGRSLSDAALTLRAYAAWGEHCVERFIGEFALVLFDERAHSLFCARDQLGDRTLFYAQHGSRVVIASEPWAILALPEFVVRADEVAAAHFFSFRAPQDGRTLFKDVFELLPGCQLSIKNGNLTDPSPYWQPAPARTIRYRSDDEYAEHFISLMDEAVRCRMRASTQPAILMSGGLDSTTIASLAARQIAPRQLSTYSYVFDQFHDCDEREYIHAVKEKYNTRSVEINCDDLWPFYNWPEWLQYPSYPIPNFYWPIRQRVYRQAHQDGVRILLSGDFGDHLYYDDAGWLADLFFDVQFARIVKEFRYHLSSKKLREYFFRMPFRRFARRVLGLLPGGAFILRRRTQAGRPWLTQSCKNILTERKQDDLFFQSL
jgi:asparagine synthase (glutamine-hydrolysing)